MILGRGLLLACLMAAAAPAFGRITEATVARDDRAIILIANPFGCAAIHVPSASLYADHRFDPPYNVFEECCLSCHRFGADGYVDVSVSNFNSWHQGSIDLAKIGFFLTTSEAEAQLEVDLSQVQVIQHAWAH